jgi:hypothetical protein
LAEFLWLPTEKWHRCTQFFQRFQALILSKGRFRADFAVRPLKNVENFVCTERKNQSAATKFSSDLDPGPGSLNRPKSELWLNFCGCRSKNGIGARNFFNDCGH